MKIKKVTYTVYCIEDEAESVKDSLMMDHYAHSGHVLWGGDVVCIDIPAEDRNDAVDEYFQEMWSEA